MSTEPLQPTIVDELPKELRVVIAENGLTEESAKGLLSDFKPMFAAAHALADRARSIQVTDATQVTEIKLSRAVRLELRTIRVDAEKKRKALKEDSLRRGRAIDGIYHVLAYLVEPLEQKLLENEEFAERAEAARKAKLKAEREGIVAELGADPNMYQLGEMTAEAFTQLVDGIRLAKEAKAAAEKKAEEERIARERAEAEERERQRAENERLKREAAEKEAQLKAEREEAAKAREEAEAKLAEERRKADEERRAAEEKARIEQDRIRAEAESKRLEAEKKAKEEREAAARKARLEKDEIEAKAKAEREKLEAEIAAQKKQAEAARVAAEKAEAERKAMLQRQEIEAKAARDREEEARAAAEREQRRAALAPEKEKLTAFSAQIRALPVPDLSSDEGKLVVVVLKQQVEKFAVFVDGKAAAL